MNKKLNFLSMEELSRIVRNEGESDELRATAQRMITNREAAFRSPTNWRGTSRCLADYVK